MCFLNSDNTSKQQKQNQTNCLVSLSLSTGVVLKILRKYRLQMHSSSVTNVCTWPTVEIDWEHLHSIKKCNDKSDTALHNYSEIAVIWNLMAWNKKPESKSVIGSIQFIFRMSNRQIIRDGTKRDDMKNSVTQKMSKSWVKKHLNLGHNYSKLWSATPNWSRNLFLKLKNVHFKH